MYKLVILSIFLACFDMCGYCQTTNKQEIKTDYIEFGSGGGFTGQSQGYLLTQTGELYKIKHALTQPDSLIFEKKICSCKTAHIFKYTKKKHILDITYNQPGNTYQFIEIKLNSKNNRLVWSNSDNAVPKSILNLSIKLHEIL